MTPDEDIEITAINAQGGIYPAPKLKVHVDGTLHLAISVFLYSSQGILLQKRAMGKYHSGGLWANSCCSHPNWGEDITACAARRCREELNLDVRPKPVGVVDYRADVGNDLIEHERAHIFVAQVDPDVVGVAPNPAEVAATRWADRAGLERELSAEPDIFSQWFQQYMNRKDDILRDLRRTVWDGVAAARAA
jgi:isopentenyl-diphosphate delta-isomerase